MYCRIKNSVNYDKKHNNTKNIRAYSHIADIYRLCLYKIEHYINHDQKNTKKNNNVKHSRICTNIPYIPDIHRLCHL